MASDRQRLAEHGVGIILGCRAAQRGPAWAHSAEQFQTAAKRNLLPEGSGSCCCWCTTTCMLAHKNTQSALCHMTVRRR